MACLAIAVGLLAGCGNDTTTTEPGERVASTMEVTSTAFQDGGSLPVRYTCDGQSLSPALRWSAVPDEVAALALVVDDPDAPDGTFVHWVALDIDPDARAVDAGSVPSGSVQARNSAGDAAYAGLCPPHGEHHYRFTVYALDGPTGLEQGADLDTALDAIDEHAIARGRIVGTYRR